MANEKRLIDANALISAIDEYMKNAYDCPLNEVADFQRVSNDTKVVWMVEGLYEATEIIDEAPTVDAVEVVRCKDCVNYCGFEHCKNGICDVDSVSKRAVYPNDFCSYGERKKDHE